MAYVNQLTLLYSQCQHIDFRNLLQPVQVGFFCTVGQCLKAGSALVPGLVVWFFLHAAFSLDLFCPWVSEAIFSCRIYACTCKGFGCCRETQYFIHFVKLLQIHSIWNFLFMIFHYWPVLKCIILGFHIITTNLLFSSYCFTELQTVTLKWLYFTDVTDLSSAG